MNMEFIVSRNSLLRALQHVRCAITKQEIYDEHIKGNFNIINVFDDEPKCVKMWREQKLQCSQAYDFSAIENDYHDNKK